MISSAYTQVFIHLMLCSYLAFALSFSELMLYPPTPFPYSVPLYPLSFILVGPHKKSVIFPVSTYYTFLFLVLFLSFSLFLSASVSCCQSVSVPQSYFLSLIISCVFSEFPISGSSVPNRLASPLNTNTCSPSSALSLVSPFLCPHPPFRLTPFSLFGYLHISKPFFFFTLFPFPFPFLFCRSRTLKFVFSGCVCRFFHTPFFF